MKVLIIDDEKQLCEALVAILKKQGIEAHCRYDGKEGLSEVTANIYDVVVLDIMMPILDGYQVLKAMREKQNHTPVILLSAKDEVNDKVKGLDIGADDYLSKPFDTRELIARIKALSRRKGEVEEFPHFNDITIDDSHQLVCGDNSISLSMKEYELLYTLIKENQTVDKDKLFQKVWGYYSNVEYTIVEVYVSFLRKKLTAIGSKTSIKSIRGLGYRLEFNNDENQEIK